MKDERSRRGRITDSFSSIKRDLGSFGTDLRSSPTEPESGAAATEKFGLLLSNFLDQQIPGSINKQAKQLYIGDDTLRRYRKGSSVPALEDLGGVFDRMKEIHGRPVPGELKAELSEALKEAREVPRRLRERLQTAQAELAETIKRDAALADRAAGLQEEITSLERQLAGQSSGGFNDPDTQQREQELRRRLMQAKADLNETLQQQQENSQELRERAKKLVEAVENYLSGTIAS